MNRALRGILGSLLALIFLATAGVFAMKLARPGQELRRSEPVPAQKNWAANTAYLPLGQIRTSTKGDNPAEPGALVLVTPWFSYPADDGAFYEELAQKTRKIKTVIAEYFAGRTKDSLLYRNEEAVKQDLVQKINAELFLGQIQNLYFDDYVFFD